MDFKEACLKAAKMEKVDGASIQHAFLGLMVTIPATVKETTKESLLSMVKIDITKEPYLSIEGNIPDLIEVIKNLAEWIAGYVKACLAIPEVQTTIESIPDETK